MRENEGKGGQGGFGDTNGCGWSGSVYLRERHHGRFELLACFMSSTMRFCQYESGIGNRVS